MPLRSAALRRLTFHVAALWRLPRLCDQHSMVGAWSNDLLGSKNRPATSRRDPSFSGPRHAVLLRGHWTLAGIRTPCIGTNLGVCCYLTAPLVSPTMNRSTKRL